MSAVASRRATQNLANETAAASALRDTIAKLTDDGETIRDTIEGETGLHEAISKVMGFIRDDEMLIVGIDRMLEALSARKTRLQDRVGYYRAAIEQAMTIGEIQTMELPDATVTVRRVQPKLEVVDESAIPAAFWTPQDPKLDRKAVTDALKAGQEVPGATLGNGGITLSIRRS
jgi:hypothetical protein